MKVACLYFSQQQSLPLSSIAEVFMRLSPQICLGKSALFIEIGKCHRLYSEEGFRARAFVLLNRLKQKARLSFGNDISEAFAKAKYATNQIDLLSLQALLDIVDPLEKDEVLRKSTQTMIEAFHHLGIQNLAQFKKIPLPELISRFGAVSILCVQRLRQEVATPWPFWRPEETIIEKDDFPYFDFYGELEPILFKLKEQLDRIFQRLWGRQLAIQKLQVRVFCEKNSINPEPFRNFEFDFISAQTTTKATLNVVKERLSQNFQKKPVQTPIESLETKVLATVPSKTGQKNLLSRHEEQMEQLQAILAQLTEAHGGKNIYHAELTQDRRPEKSWRKVDLLSNSKDKFHFFLDEKFPLRPTCLLQNPIKVKILEDHIEIQNRRFKITHRPLLEEHISGDWFAEKYSRRYFKLDLEKAPSVCVFQTDDQNFYLHGYYG